MKFSEQWLREWINPALDTIALTEKMAMLGLTVDAVTSVAGKFSGVVVGEVITCEKHPNAEKLSCCTVNVGDSALLKIVCGAPNVRTGLKVAVAKIGAVLPGDFQIKEAKLRGELSQGMLCSAKELQLELGKSLQDGIVELPHDAKVGEDFNAYFKANDCIIDVDITPNRADALSIKGLARDLAAALQLSVIGYRLSAVNSNSGSAFSVVVHSPEDCPRYVCRVIRDVNLSVQTPSFIQHALQRANIRLINAIVDVTNYVMLELGQPMHAYDLSKIKNQIIVRRGKNEKIKLLDEQEIITTENDLIIADSEKPLALAGIMGGMDSGVSINTKDILLEAAFFTPKTICLSKRRHNMSSESSHRFERGVDFDLQVVAIARATQLILEIAGGTPEKITDVVSKQVLPKREPIFLARNQIARVLGMALSDEDVVRILSSLHMSVNPTDSGWNVTPPSFRFDMTLPIDLIEELARMTGYQSIPAEKMQATLTMSSLSSTQFNLKNAREFLVNRGYHEAVTYSFISPAHYALFSTQPAMTLKNPLSQEMSVMRSSLLPGLLQAIAMNLNHQCERVRFFETGMCFVGDGNALTQTNKLAIAVTGNIVAEQWGDEKRVVDFYDLKLDMNLLFSKVVMRADPTSAITDNRLPITVLHPGRFAILYQSNKPIGFIGEIHPAILNQFDIKQPVVVCELDLDQLEPAGLTHCKPFSRFPFVRRDLAIVLDETITAAELEQKIRDKAGSLLVGLCVFDVYRGKNIEVGKKSIALGLTFQDPSRTLRDEEINEKIQDVVTMLAQELNATLR